MGVRTSYAPGTFCWPELLTSDAGAAKEFYGSLFSWGFDDRSAGGAGTYTTARLNGEQVAGLYEPDDESPPSWLLYVSVADVDAAAAGAASLGGTLIAAPFDVLEAGRAAVLADPAGAVFALWQPREQIGATQVNDPGCFTWCDLSTTDTEAAASFYGELFGWEVEAVETGDGPPYAIVRNGGVRQAGIAGVRDVGVPPHWLPYFTVPSTDAAVDRVRSLEGDVLAGPMDVPTGRIAAARDPQGAAFALFAGAIDD